MSSEPLLVVIIETPESSRSDALISKFEGDSRFEVVRLPALMLYTNSDINKLNIDLRLEEFIYFQGRLMSPQEIGCAISHNLARKFVGESLNGGVILEDDARVDNPDLFYRSACDFLEKEWSIPAVLSMNEFRYGSVLNLEREGMQSLLSRPFLALAYALTPCAGKALYQANEPINTVADWPRTKIKYFSLFNSLVRHGDDKNQSTIDLHGVLNRNGLKLSKKVSQLTFVSFFTSKPKSISIFRYIEEVYCNRLTWHLDSVLRRFHRVVSK